MAQQAKLLRSVDWHLVDGGGSEVLVTMRSPVELGELSSSYYLRRALQGLVSPDKRYASFGV